MSDFSLHSMILGEAGQMARDMAQLTHIASALPGSEYKTHTHQDQASFSQALIDSVRSIDDQDRLASAQMEAVDSGNSDDLVGAMITSQEAKLTYDLFRQVRNKVVGAVDDLLKMPV